MQSVAFLFSTPFTFVRVSFVQKQYDPQLTIDYLLNESASSGGNHICAILSSPSESLDSATKWPQNAQFWLVNL